MHQTQLMGVVNATPDSFSDGGRYVDVSTAISHGARLAEEGAAILDIGGESTRPGADDVAVQEELDRIIPVIEGLKSRVAARISVDTRKPDVAAAAASAGASIWNDVSALTYEPRSVAEAVRLGCDVVLMHAQGAPRTMQIAPQYGDVVEEVLEYLRQRIATCVAAGIPKERLIADPGIGFGKTLDHNLQIFGALDRFLHLGVRILVGASRKRFIAALDRDGPAWERTGGSVAAAVYAVRKGVSILRVHDVAATRQALAVARALEKAQTER
jgi:dihydropteroate synthase